MGTVREPESVKYFTGVLFPGPEYGATICSQIENNISEIEYKSDIFEFRVTDYYSDEIGPRIYKQFLVFKGLHRPEYIVDIKLKTNELEKELALILNCGYPRPVNLDPGYVTLSKMVLATTKDYSHRIYIGRGIYAEVTLYFRDGTFTPWPWTYPDYRSEDYILFFNTLRHKYKKELRMHKDMKP